MASCLRRCIGCETLAEKEILTRLKALISVMRREDGTGADPTCAEKVGACAEAHALVISLRKLLAQRVGLVNTSVLRLLRYLMHSTVMRALVHAEWLDLFVARSLEDGLLSERVEALKLFDLAVQTDCASISDAQARQLLRNKPTAWPSCLLLPPPSLRPC